MALRARSGIAVIARGKCSGRVFRAREAEPVARGTIAFSRRTAGSSRGDLPRCALGRNPSVCAIGIWHRCQRRPDEGVPMGGRHSPPNHRPRQPAGGVPGTTPDELAAVLMRLHLANAGRASPYGSTGAIRFQAIACSQETHGRASLVGGRVDGQSDPWAAVVPTRQRHRGLAQPAGEADGLEKLLDGQHGTVVAGASRRESLSQRPVPRA